MTDSAAATPAAPLHYAVLVPGQTGWCVLYANGDLASARAKAEEWAMANRGEQAVVVQYVDHVEVIPAAKWAKP